MSLLHDEMTAVPFAPRADLKAFRTHNPYVALGLAVSHLMTKPAFANLRFGDWSRILTGQMRSAAPRAGTDQRRHNHPPSPTYPPRPHDHAS